MSERTKHSCGCQHAAADERPTEDEAGFSQWVDLGGHWIKPCLLHIEYAVVCQMRYHKVMTEIERDAALSAGPRGQA